MSCFMCPVCKGDLHSDGKAYTCKNNHSFDISKDGYVNLLMSQKSSFKRHGDDKLMVRSRRDFLNKGYYKALCDALCDCVKANFKSNSVVIDVGCGEGYYTNAVRNSFEGQLFGIDISKDALRFASKAIKNAGFSVASAFSLPFKNESADCIINIFAPSAYEDFYRVLKSDGLLIKAVPLENHLWDLKCALYDEPYKNKPEKRNDELFELVSFDELEYKINVADKDDILNLFRMTPYYYKTGKAEAERLLKLDSLETTVHFGLEIYKKRSLL